MSASNVVSLNLGIGAKSSNALVLKPKPQTAIEGKKNKYRMQRHAQTLLYTKGASKQHRVCTCHRNCVGDGVSVYRDSNGENSRFGGLISCGSVWSCPICNSKITEARREDMHKAQVAWNKQGGACLLNTLTFPHEADMPLDELLKKFSKALDYYKNGRVYKRIFGTAVALVTQKIKTKKPLAKVTQGEFARLGTVRSLEVTHGINGWHPHVHEVLFMDNYDLIGDKGARARDELTKAWVASLLKAGLGDNSKLNDMLNIAWDIRGGDYVSDYINKFGREPLNINGWTISHEVTKANSKSGRVAKMKIGNEYHYTPFQLLNYSLEGDKQAGQLFKEFSAAFEGKRMNYWTNGLKDWFGLHDKDDADLAEEPDTEQITEDFVLRLSTDEWSLILKTNTRWECLNAAARYGEAGVKDFLEGLTLRPVTHSGDFRDRARPNPDLFFH